VEPFTPTAADGAYVPAVAETHSGLVFFAGDRAYKLKKALDLGFVDLTSRERRQAVCEREVELNRRLAPDVYLGVADVRDPAGEVCDHLVVMRRMPDDRRLSKLVLEGAQLDATLDHLARLLADFHSRAERGPDVDRAAGADALDARWTANTVALGRFDDSVVDPEEVASVDGFAHRYLAGRGPLFASRVAAGRACDGHGDLLADDIFCLDDGPRILDCLEFDDDLRRDDVLADVAFLAMDLERLGRPDLAQRLLASYGSAAGDRWPASLAHHHIAYRAQVRALVSAIRSQQGDRDAAAQARALLGLARSHLEAGRVRLVLVGGQPGTGKSTLARGLGTAIGAQLLRSDVVRKEIAGIAGDRSGAAAFGEGIYSGESTAATYREMIDRAREALGMGSSVVLDASWSTEAHRVEARRVAEATSSDLVELRCVAPFDVIEQRIAARAASGGDPSDADANISAAMAGTADAWPLSTTIDTLADPETVVRSALVAIGAAV